MSKVSNRPLKKGLLTRLRSWFEQGKIIIPYGNDETRKVMNILLQELESHTWKSGVIVDKGKHNDTVMALAHAIDQYKTTQNAPLPVASASVNMSNWGKPTTSNSKFPRNRGNARRSGKYKTFF